MKTVTLYPEKYLYFLTLILGVVSHDINVLLLFPHQYTSIKQKGNTVLTLVWR